MKRRWPLVLLALLFLLLSGAVVFTVISARALRGSVPGRSPLLSMAATRGGFLVGVENALYTSRDGVNWARPPRFTNRRNLPAGAPGGPVVASGSELFRFSDSLSAQSQPLLRLKGQVTALSGDPGGRIYVVQDASRIAVVENEGGVSRSFTPRRGPREILAIDMIAGPPDAGQSEFLFAGGLTSGVWRSSEPERSWLQVLKTPVRAILVDDEDSKRVFLGTAGGVLVSTNSGLSWSFTGLRVPVEALAQAHGRYYALLRERLVYQSPNGQSGWEPVVN